MMMTMMMSNDGDDDSELIDDSDDGDVDVNIVPVNHLCRKHSPSDRYR